MNSITNSIVLTLLHSIWQSGILLLLFTLNQKLFNKQSPETKRKKLFLILLIQLFISGLTFVFCIYKIDNDAFAFLSDFIVPDRSFYGIPFSTLSSFIFIAYLLFLFIKTIKTFISWIQFRNNISSGLQKPQVEFRLFTNNKSLELGIKRKVNLWYSDKILSPITFGHFKPVILMPIALINKLTIVETESLIIHELTHIKNNDFLMNWLLLITAHVYFFNPFIKNICTQLKWEREVQCDIQVLQYNYSDIDYANALYKAAEQNIAYNDFQLTAVMNHQFLYKRIKFFTAKENLNFRKTNHLPVKSFFSTAFSFIVITFLTITLFQFFNSKNNLNPNQFVSFQKKEKFSSLLISPNLKQQSTIVATPINNKNKPFRIHHEELPVTHNSIQNDINLNVLSENLSSIYASAKNEEITHEKQIVVKEENPAIGKIITKSYRLMNRNGKWETELLWVIEEKTNPEKLIRKDSIYIPSVQ